MGREVPASKATDYHRPSSAGSGGRRRVTGAYLAEVRGRLGERDWAVLGSLERVRVLSGGQLERLLFDDIASTSRGRTRRRVLGRLVELGLVVTLQRRIGGVRAGSAGLVYALSAGGQRLLDQEVGILAPRYRLPGTPGTLFLAHALTVAEIYVALSEECRRVLGVELRTFDAEGAARWPIGASRSGFLRPDALVVLGADGIEDVWWLEVDRDTESLPRIGAMLRRYLDFAHSGLAGPGGVVPRVLVSVTSEERADAVRSLVRRLPPPAAALFVVARDVEVPDVLVREFLSDEAERPP